MIVVKLTTLKEDAFLNRHLLSVVFKRGKVVFKATLTRGWDGAEGVWRVVVVGG